MTAFTIEKKKGRLLADQKIVTQALSRNFGGTLIPKILVMHYTAIEAAENAISWLRNPQAKASAHLVIDQAGVVTQLVPFNVIAWHAGVSSYHGQVGVNDMAIGIELANAGWLGKRADGAYFEQLTHKVIPPERVVLAPHKNRPQLGVMAWEAYPPAQLAAAEAVAMALCKAYGLKDVVGHEDVAPARKTDPGPAFPMHSFAARVLGRS